MTPSAGAAAGLRPGARTAGRALVMAGVAGTLHALASLYWALGGTWLLETLGARVLQAFAGLEWLLLPVAVAKLTGAWVPVVLHHRQWPHARIWRPLCWGGAAVLITWGGSNTVVGQVVLAGVVQPEGGYDRAAMIGHAWLWDPLFLLWGTALAVGLWLSRRMPEPAPLRPRVQPAPDPSPRRSSSTRTVPPSTTVTSRRVERATARRPKGSLRQPAGGRSTDGDPSRPVDLTYVDTHALEVRADPASVWAALLDFATNHVGMAPGNPLARLLGTHPPRGFEVVGTEAGKWLALAGRHHFARYQLVLQVSGEGEQRTTLRGHTYATFPGLHGRAYRAMVIRTGLHAVATTRMLRTVTGMAERSPSDR